MHQADAGGTGRFPRPTGTRGFAREQSCEAGGCLGEAAWGMLISAASGLLSVLIILHQPQSVGSAQGGLCTAWGRTEVPVLPKGRFGLLGDLVVHRPGTKDRWTVPRTQVTVSMSLGRQELGDSACRGCCGLGGRPQCSRAAVVLGQEIPSCQQQLFFSADPDLLVCPESLQGSLASPVQVSC